jgi:hypothetical protein
VPIASAAGLQWANVEEKDDGAVILLGSEVIQLVNRAVESSVHGHKQDPVLEHAGSGMQVGLANSVCGQG